MRILASPSVTATVCSKCAASDPSREAIVQEADGLSKDAKVLRDRLNDSKPSSAEADQVMSRAAKLHTFIQGRQVPGAANVWTGIRPQLARE